ncbi:Oligopeptide transporter [Trichinella spiralis]|uniref:Oligopeptide transporter n=1 Tax=Trichinella spiralis TaxID=6334 RepID=A0ABR3L0R3_TRISP
MEQGNVQKDDCLKKRGRLCVTLGLKMRTQAQMLGACSEQQYYGRTVGLVEFNWAFGHCADHSTSAIWPVKLNDGGKIAMLAFLIVPLHLWQLTIAFNRFTVNVNAKNVTNIRRWRLFNQL